MPVAHRDIVVIGASAGGVEALGHLLVQFPRDLPAAVFVVQHMAQSDGLLVDIMQRVTPLPVRWAEQGAPIELGAIVIARPGAHLLFEDGHMRLDGGPRENLARPSINRLFRSAAARYGSRSIGVLLTGMLDDGVAGLGQIHEAGGRTLVQDPREAEFPELPRNAVAAVRVDRIMPLRELGHAIVEYTHDRAEPLAPPDSVRAEADLDRGHSEPDRAVRNLDKLGQQTPFMCPECGGPLWQLGRDGNKHYRCYLGHAMTAREIMANSGNEIEGALWNAVRALYDRAAMLESLAHDAERLGNAITATLLDNRAKEVRRQAELSYDFMHELVRKL